MILARRLFLFLDGDIEVRQGLVEVVQLVLQQAAEEVHRALLLRDTLDRRVQELECCPDLFSFGCFISVLIRHRITVGTYDRDHIQTKSIFVLREDEACLGKVL